MKRNHIIAGIGVAGILALSSCASATEPWNDAPVDRKVDDPAVILSMPDGYANVAQKCDDSGHLMFTTRDGKGGGKVVSVVTDPAACPKAGIPVTLAKQR